MNQSEKIEIMMVAAEASSSHYALKLIQEWRRQEKAYHFFGVGSQAMEDEGFERLGKSEEMAIVGAVEILEHYSDLKKVFNKLVAEATKRKPRFVIVMDYPEFNLMLAKKLHQAGIKVFYYISPQVWAWRKGRVFTIKKYCEKVFLLFPFEVDFYESKKVPYEFVGHPLLDELDPDLLNSDKIRLQKEKYGIKQNEKLLALMPGSRRGELNQHLSIQLEVGKRVLKKYPHVRLAILVAPTLSREEVLNRMEDFKSPFILLQDDPNKMISMADFVLVASGTATLMVGLLQKPMVIMYRTKWLTGVILNWFIRKLKFFGLVNLILNKEVVPELKQEQVETDRIFMLVEKYITDEAYTQSVINELKKLPEHLGQKGASKRVVECLEKYV